MYKIDSRYRDIYRNLQDEESRRLFSCRYRYYKDGDTEHLREEQGISHRFNRNAEIDKWTSFLEDAQRCRRGAVVFGAGKNLQSFCADLLRKDAVGIRAVCDSAEEKQGKIACGYTNILKRRFAGISWASRYYHAEPQIRQA